MVIWKYVLPLLQLEIFVNGWVARMSWNQTGMNFNDALNMYYQLFCCFIAFYCQCYLFNIYPTLNIDFELTFHLTFMLHTFHPLVLMSRHKKSKEKHLKDIQNLACYHSIMLCLPTTNIYTALTNIKPRLPHNTYLCLWMYQVDTILIDGNQEDFWVVRLCCLLQWII